MLFFPAASYRPFEDPIPLADFIALLQRVQASINPKIYPSQLVYGAGGISIEGIREVTEAEVHAKGIEQARLYLAAMEGLDTSKEGLETGTWSTDDVCSMLKNIIGDFTAAQTPSPKA